MLYLVIKAAISGVIVAAVSEIARRYPGWGGLRRLAAADLAPGDDLAVARFGRCRRESPSYR